MISLSVCFIYARCYKVQNIIHVWGKVLNCLHRLIFSCGLNWKCDFVSLFTNTILMLINITIITEKNMEMVKMLLLIVKKYVCEKKILKKSIENTCTYTFTCLYLYSCFVYNLFAHIMLYY